MVVDFYPCPFLGVCCCCFWCSAKVLLRISGGRMSRLWSVVCRYLTRRKGVKKSSTPNFALVQKKRHAARRSFGTLLDLSIVLLRERTVVKRRPDKKEGEIAQLTARETKRESEPVVIQACLQTQSKRLLGRLLPVQSLQKSTTRKPASSFPMSMKIKS